MSIQFEIPELTDLAITKIVVPNFRDLSESTHKFLQNIPIQHFITIIASDDLYVEEEFELVFLVKKCLEHHQEKGQPDYTLAAELLADPVVWNSLTKAEQDTRTKEIANRNKLATDKTKIVKERADGFLNVNKKEK